MKFLTFLATLLFLVVYCLIGGVIMMLLESGTEKDFKKDTNQSLYAFIDNNSCLNEGELMQLQSLVVRMSETAVLVRNDASTFYRSKFDLRSAMFVSCCYFSGFGLRNLNPTTTGGKVFSIFYLLIAVYYLFFITYACSQVVDIIVMKLLGRLVEVQKHRIRFILLRQALMLLLAIVFFVLIPAAAIQAIEPWNFLETIYFCIIYLITIGFSDYMPGDAVVERSEEFMQWYRMIVGFWILVATLWIGIIMVQYSWIIGFFFWETTDLMISDQLSSVRNRLEEGKKERSFKRFLRKRREARKTREELRKIKKRDEKYMREKKRQEEILRAEGKMEEMRREEIESTEKKRLPRITFLPPSKDPLPPPIFNSTSTDNYLVDVVKAPKFEGTPLPASDYASDPSESFPNFAKVQNSFGLNNVVQVSDFTSKTSYVADIDRSSAAFRDLTSLPDLSSTPATSYGLVNKINV